MRLSISFFPLIISLLFKISILAFENKSPSFHNRTRRKLASVSAWAEFESGRWTPPFHKIPGTSRPNLPLTLKSLLATQETFQINETSTSSLSFIVSNKSFVNSLSGEVLKQGFNGRLLTPTKESDKLYGLADSDNTLQDLMDIIIVLTSKEDATLHFLEPWKEFIENMQLIFLLNRNLEGVQVSPPSWANYILYTRKDIDQYLGGNSWIIGDTSSTIRAFGYLVSDRKYIYTIDSNSRPTVDFQGVKINPIQDHMNNLLSPGQSQYFNTMYEPFGNGSDFDKGYPYTLRAGITTAGLSIYAFPFPKTTCTYYLP